MYMLYPNHHWNMESINFTKNIRFLDKISYKLTLLHKIESVMKRMRWKLFFSKHKYQYNNLKDAKIYGFQSPKTPQCDNLLLDFKKELFPVIDKFKFANITNDLQQKILKYIAMIKKSKKIIIKADETGNHYKVDVDI